MKEQHVSIFICGVSWFTLRSLAFIQDASVHCLHPGSRANDSKVNKGKSQIIIEGCRMLFKILFCGSFQLCMSSIQTAELDESSER